jgi:hypothetical protein
MTEEIKQEITQPVVTRVSGKKDRRRHPHPYKGIPRDQWPGAKLKASVLDDGVAVDRERGSFDHLDQILSDEEIEAIRKESKYLAVEEKRRIAKEQLRARLLAEERAKLDPEERLVKIKIDVPAMCIIDRMNQTGLSVNNRIFVHGRTYPVSLSLARDLQFMMYMANRNERALGSPHRDLRISTRTDARKENPVPEIMEIG